MVLQAPTVGETVDADPNDPPNEYFDTFTTF